MSISEEEEKTKKEYARKAAASSSTDKLSGFGFITMLFAFFLGADKKTLDNGGAADQLADALDIDNSKFKQTVSDVISGETTLIQSIIKTNNDIDYSKADLTKSKEVVTQHTSPDNPFVDLMSPEKETSNSDGDINLKGNSTASHSDPWQSFLAHLIKREGYRNDVYLDSLGKPTVGVGHLIKSEDNLSIGDTISDERVLSLLETDAKSAYDAAIKQAEELGINDKDVVTSLASVNYQLGVNWRNKFPNTWEHMKQGNFEQAIKNVELSLWNKQTPVRVDDFQIALTRMNDIRNNKISEIALNNIKEGAPTQLASAFNPNELGVQGVPENDPAQPDPLTPIFSIGGVDEIILAAQRSTNADMVENAAKPAAAAVPA